MNMYGWLEIGGFFQGTSSNDIVLRSSSQFTQVAIGNPTNGADLPALLVKDNTVGIKCIPEASKSLSVCGDILFYNGICDFKNSVSNLDIACDGLELRFCKEGYRTTYINTIDSRVSTDSLVTRTIFTERKVLNNVLIISKSLSSYVDMSDAMMTSIPSHDITIDLRYANDFIEGGMFIVNNITYMIREIVDASNNLTIRITTFSPFADPLVLTVEPGRTTTITLLEDWFPVSSVAQFEILQYAFYVDNYTFTDSLTTSNAYVQIHLIIKDQGNTPVLPIGALYIMLNSKTIAANPSLVLRLESLTEYNVNGKLGYVLQFTGLDVGRVDLEASLLSILQQLGPGVQRLVYLYPLNFQEPPWIVEDNIVVGYTIDGISQRICYKLSESRLATMTSNFYGQHAELINYAIEYITLGNRPTEYNVRAYKPENSNHVVIDTHGVRDEVFNVQRQAISYKLKGVPLRVIQCSRTSFDTADFLLESVFSYSFTMYKGGYFYWLDNGDDNAYILRVLSVKKSVVLGLASYEVSILANSFILDSPFFFERNRIVYLIPFNYTSQTRLGDQQYNSYVPKSLSVGTFQQKDTLTVNGDTCFMGELNMYNSLNGFNNAFNMAYTDSNVFNMNDKILIAQNNIELRQATRVYGTVTANDYVQYSDIRLKSNIAKSSPHDDLKAINKLQVKTFKLQGNESTSKGIIAQEIVDIFPLAITTSKHFLEFNTTVIANVDHDTTCLYLPSQCLDTMITRPTTEIKVAHIHTNKCYHVLVQNVKDMSDGTSIWKLHSTYGLPERVVLLGVLDEVMLVNYDVLYMSAINAIQELSTKVEKLEKRL